MPSLERLTPDQRAVLALVLQRGKSYDEIAGLLAIDRAAVRDRALAALDALGPAEPRVPAQNRALITDYLLGQLPGRVRDEVRNRLASSPSERAWARVLAGELAPIAVDPLPQIPSGTPEPVATPDPVAPAAPPPTSEPAVIPTLGASPRETPRTTTPAAAVEAPTSQSPSGLGPAGSAPRSSSRLGGGALLALAALIAAVVVIVIIATSSGSTPKKTGGTTPGNTPTTTASTPTTTSTGTSTTPHVIAQIILKPPSGSGKQAGAAEIVTEGSVTGVVVAADHLAPNTAHNAYAVWLSNPGGGPSHLLGYVSPGVTKKGILKTSGPLPANVTSYKEILITLETTTNTKTPGQTILQGALS